MDDFYKYKDKQEIIIDKQSLKEIPLSLTSNMNYNSTMTLDLSNNNIRAIPSNCFYNFPALQALILNDNKLELIPNSVSCLFSLKTLKLNHNNLHILPQEIGELNNLEILSVMQNLLIALPKTIGKLKNTLKVINLNANRLKYLPNEFCQLCNLEELHLYNNNFEALPYKIGCLPNLKIFSIEWFQYAADIIGIPEKILLFNFKNFCLIHKERKKKNFSFNDIITNNVSKEFNLCARTNLTCLHKAAYNNHLGMLEQLVKFIKNVDASDQSSYTPLHCYRSE